MTNTPTKRAGRAGRSRGEDILRLLREQMTASVTDMAARFDVSEMTIRRDIERLVATGQVIRVPGGARLAHSVAFEKTFAERLQKMGDAKSRIGRAAAGLVKEGEAIVLDSGTTTLCIARNLRTHRNLVVITFSVAALEELRGGDSIRVELTGGIYRRSSHDLVGAGVSEGVAKVRANKVFFGAAALSFERGVMAFDAEWPRTLLGAGAERILVLDSSKIGDEALYVLCPLKEVDLVITDSGVKPMVLARLKQHVRVLVAD